VNTRIAFMNKGIGIVNAPIVIVNTAGRVTPPG
jgi:hypothetical protein